jgi:hypothetical protein
MYITLERGRRHFLGERSKSSHMRSSSSKATHPART